MPWITLTEAHVHDRLAFEEAEVIEDVGGGEGNRLEGILEQVTALVRGKVASCKNNKLGPSGTIPEECLWAAATIAKHDLRSSLPSTGSDDEGDLRKEEFREAMKFLNDVARCDIGISDDSGTGTQSISPGCWGGTPLYDF